ncbi:hypothetical protein F5B22DRAFT_627313 [Xylaria bambusicola]|uniref:uncharacterized protein n=1 Tax=Xylaria bambusicola TaxID=326684 RepID=UPI0020074364|nr:uncharacterized protein F5B22DRAFT_627313 [Xylaria bambusicola]KAI0505531.1 hypothetical protein F5B22DRAFT_627313 [Xylaria bambusicola]
MPSNAYPSNRYVPTYIAHTCCNLLCSSSRHQKHPSKDQSRQPGREPPYHTRTQSLIMAENTGTSYSTDPALYIYTSLTAGSSHTVTATSRLETILRANRVPFKAIDIATDEKARMLWGRRAGKDEGGRQRKLPALIQMGMVLGDLVEIEEWNEYGELKEHVTIYYDDFTIPPKSQAAPPVAMRPLNQPFPKSGVAPSPAATTATTGQPAPAPPAPPLPTDKDKTKIPLSSPTSTSTGKKAANAATSTKAPISNLAEEAAKKAKQVQLDRLREKVHGKKDVAPSAKTSNKDKENEKPLVASSSPAVATPKKTASTTDSVNASMNKLSIGNEGSSSGAGLQSPTTGKWRSAATSDAASQPLLQSPTTGTWKGGSLDSVVTENRGSVVASAPPENIAAVKKAAAIPEAASSEDEDSDEEDTEEEDSEEDEEEDEDEEDEEDDDDDDDDDDEDEDEDDDDEEEESEDEAEKVKVKK